MEMKDFAWNVFCNSGNVEAFLLYKHEDKDEKNDEKEESLNYGKLEC